ncbi:MAG: anti-sigma regulatory factor [Spirochaetes bacterium]|nr:anti-sigma regulatory factor [Spirochaetota bacterium]
MELKVLKRSTFPIRSEEDIVKARQIVRNWANEVGFKLVDQTKLVTATSELARNTFVHGGGGEMMLEQVEDGTRSGLRITFQDHGPGIPDVTRALQDGYSTAGGLGLGLGGAKRLVHEFSIQSEVGKGTVVIIVKWV